MPPRVNKSIYILIYAAVCWKPVLLDAKMSVLRTVCQNFSFLPIGLVLGGLDGQLKAYDQQLLCDVHMNVCT